jgi:hypothetical protein
MAQKGQCTKSLWRYSRRSFASTVADYDNPEYMLRSSIWFALQQCRYQPPKTHDATARDAYYGKVADFCCKSSRPTNGRPRCVAFLRIASRVNSRLQDALI